MSRVLNRFVLLAYLDLKKFVFYYWFAFPALSYPKARIATHPPSYLKDILDERQRRSLEESYFSLPDAESKSFFFIHQASGGEIAIRPLSDYAKLKKAEASVDDKLFLGFADPSTRGDHPGWPLRNLLAFVAKRFPETSNWTVVCLRLRARSSDFSLCLDVTIEPSSLSGAAQKEPRESGNQKEEEGKDEEAPKCVGWEKNDKQKLLPRCVDMSSILDPSRLAQNAVNLNLKLMRWRLVPVSALLWILHISFPPFRNLDLHMLSPRVFV